MNLATAVAAADLSATRATVDEVAVVRLADSGREIQVSIAPSIGNLAYEMNVRGKNVFWKPDMSLTEIRDKRALSGNPFLAPWANRLDSDGYYANGKRYSLNLALGNVRRDGNKNPIHGLLAFSPDWEVVELQADGASAWVTSRLEFWRYPDLMEQFPFAHTIDMTYRLRGGALEVETLIRNHAKEPMPVAIGYHPYFQVHDAPRDEWKVYVAARERYELSKVLIPTGARQPAELPKPLTLKGTQLDDVFGDLERGPDGNAVFWVEGKKERVTVSYGPNYSVAVIYAPQGRNFICFEPMAAITNAFNLAHEGKYGELQQIAPGGEWRATYTISASGF